ncbi:deoxyuridine 5'-triphosphate nucleotidohydrolase [Dendroctonus ponderosae]|uniref:Deoxyuridine 5'-triphosphate nucleotidohydrolase n=1 Tax=Dendroctonus ponderosae TaxID=77166 RepID=J3JXE2_DENPD|nr:deoxyuridine 5'-triphosphate nucleotidohydrolase [Dendroctonus ponderosae]AEE62873.1 unknown [Dendroctonus ponderosae]KAH1014660.1 hypothetical protein HUJ05_012505 [Dendroctonus ponderosae]
MRFGVGFFNWFLPPKVCSLSRTVLISSQPHSPSTNMTEESTKMSTENLAMCTESANRSNEGKDRLVLKYIKAEPGAFAPTRATPRSAGYDLKSAVDTFVMAEGKSIVTTGLKIELPDGCYGRIAPRSGLAMNNFINVAAGVIDQDYRGIVKVILFNHSHLDFHIKKGDRIAQLICERIYYPDIEEVQDLPETARGEGGFGSSGTN